MAHSFIHIIKAADCKDFELQLPIITLFGEDETAYYDAQTVKRKIGDEAWRELSAKYVQMMVDSSIVVEDFDPILSTF
jgi:hypothetical protein